MFTYMRSIDFRFMSKVYSFMKCLVLNLKQKLTAICIDYGDEIKHGTIHYSTIQLK